MSDSIRLKWLLSESDIRAGMKAETLPLLSVSISWGVRRREATDTSTRAAAEDLSNYKICRAGDLVINRMRAFQGALGIAPEDGIVSPDYAVLSVGPRIDTRWLKHFLTSRSTVATMASLVRGIGGTEAGNVRTPRLNIADLLSMTAPLVSTEEQGVITDYLDHETARIDTLIDEQQRLIELLHERRHALVGRVFDTRLPNTRLQNACTDVVDCPHTTPEVADDGAYEAVRTASVRNGKFRPGNGLPVSAETWEARNAGGAPSVGDVLFTREAPAGEACMVPNEQICLGQRMVLLRINDAVCVGEFLLWQIYSDRVQDHFLLSANGSTVANVRLPILRTTPIWLPSLAEQRQIVTHLDEQTTKIDELVSETEQFIELARERRSALITAAVTGQIDVREAA
ncbi:type I restriction enzyme S subunit [Streptomyces sp. 840.1]|uniref:restriction endonuclease subunit S n=1 Tax=Streptomyces sp. 840.1 TaxID=2485152 RepID=UPI000F46FD13|nr:restriction endonuclease subunit S [Streptomyces sp. 840.1]ROQ66346.1 type I restriction enzyme S subunit [Streptomyces sp. 840.1]